MWYAMRAELSYFRPHLIFAWAIAGGVAVLTIVLNELGGGEDPSGFVGSGLPGMLLIIASMVVGFIAQGTRSEERRSRLCLAGPLTPRQLGALMVLLPVSLMALGMLAGVVVFGVAGLLTGNAETATLLIVGSVGSQMLAIVQMGPLAQEASAAHRQRRRLASAVAWFGFFSSILLLIALQWYPIREHVIFMQLAVALAIMTTSATLFARRTDFTR